MHFGNSILKQSALNSASLAVLLIGRVRESKVAQKRQQVVVWLESPDGGVHRRRFLERLFLERKLRVKVDLRCLERRSERSLRARSAFLRNELYPEGRKYGAMFDSIL